MTGRIRFDPEPVTWLVPTSQRGWFEFAPEPGHPQLTRIWLKGDGSTAPPRSLTLTRADIKRMCVTLHQMVTPPDAGTQ